MTSYPHIAKALQDTLGEPYEVTARDADAPYVRFTLSIGRYTGTASIAMDDPANLTGIGLDIWTSEAARKIKNVYPAEDFAPTVAE